MRKSTLSVDKKCEDEMLDLEKYTQTIDENGEKIDYFYRIRPFTKTSRVKDANGKYETISVDCQILYSFSQSKRKYDLQKIEEGLKKADKTANDYSTFQPQFMGCTEQCRSEIDEDKINTIDLNGYLNADLINKRIKYAVFSCLLFYNPKNENCHQIIDEKNICENLFKIEESFMILKDNFKINQIYLRNKDRIYAHIILSIISLIILRLIELKCYSNDIKLTSNDILNSFGNMFLTLMKVNSKNIFINQKEVDHANLTCCSKKIIKTI